MLRRAVAVLLVVAGLRLGAAATPEASLELGMRAFRAGDFASARVDLADAVRQTEGQPDRLQSFATALVYLAMSQFRLGSEDDARATILRLVETERLTPIYASLSLGNDAAEFETLAAALAPEAPLRREMPLPPVRPVAAPAPAPAPITGTPAPVTTDSAAVRAALNSLRQAEALADQGELGEANGIYTRLAANEPREIVAAAAVGLYRTGAYREAVQAFARLGALGRGEEDLHYYYAVSLYEAGSYEAARRELLCALPFIELTDEVARYRTKIEQALAHS